MIDAIQAGTPPSELKPPTMMTASLIVTATFTLHSLLANLQFIASESWPQLTTPGEPYYHPLWTAVYGVAVIMDMVLVALMGMVLTAYFRRRRTFITLLIVWFGLGLFTTLATIGLTALIPGMIEDGSLRGSGSWVVYQIIVIGFWLSSLLSQRTKAIFVH